MSDVLVPDPGRKAASPARVAAAERYRVPPKKVYRALGLGVARNGYVKVVAGFTFQWWVPDYLGPLRPVFVEARVLRFRPSQGSRIVDPAPTSEAKP